MNSIVRFLVIVATVLFAATAVAAPRSPSNAQAQQQRQQLRPPAVPLTWEAQWFAAWRRAAAYYPIVAAPGTVAHPACQGNLGIDTIVRNAILATANRKYGDAAQFIGQFQDKTLCLTRKGARGVEFALSMYLHNAVTRLPPDQAQIAVNGSLNLGALIFDQLQYTRSSWWLLTANMDAARIQPFMQFYPRQELGLFMYDSHRGYLVQSRQPNAIDQLLLATRSLGNFGLGTCELLDMSSTGFRCPDAQMARAGALPVNGSTGPGGAFGLMPVQGPDVGMACLLASVASSGVRGQLACISKYAVPPNMATTTPADLMKMGDPQPGVIDKICARGEEAGDDTGGDEPAPEAKPTEPSTWDKVVDAVGSVVSAVASAVASAFDPTPPVISELGQLASPEGAQAIEGGLTAMQAMQSQQTLLSDDENAMARFEQQRANMHRPNPGGAQRVVDDGSGSSSMCGARSNAAERAKAMYSCLNGSDWQFSQKGFDGMNTVKSGGTLDPRLIHTTPDDTGAVSGPMSCLLQGGDLVRNTPEDRRCAISHCAPGADCQCNTGGTLVAEPKQMIRPAVAEPRCIEGKCPSDTVGTPGSLGTQGSTTPVNPKLGGPAPPPRGDQIAPKPTPN